jgi:hypothetical protein
MDSTNYNISSKLDALQRNIESGDFVAEAKSAREWGGADVIVSCFLNDSIKKWLEDTPIIISAQDTQPRRRAVITKYSRELSWLLYELREIFSGMIDYVSKYDFYGVLAESAIDYLDSRQENTECNELLKTVLDRSRRLLSDENSR